MVLKKIKDIFFEYYWIGKFKEHKIIVFQYKNEKFAFSVEKEGRIIYKSIDDSYFLDKVDLNGSTGDDIEKYLILNGIVSAKYKFKVKHRKLSLVIEEINTIINKSPQNEVSIKIKEVYKRNNLNTGDIKI